MQMLYHVELNSSNTCSQVNLNKSLTGLHSYMMSCSWHATVCVCIQWEKLVFISKCVLRHQHVSSVWRAALIRCNAARRWNKGPLRLKCKWVFGCWRPQLRLDSPSPLKMAPVFVSRPPAQSDYFWLHARKIKETRVEPERSGSAVQALICGRSVK